MPRTFGRNGVHLSPVVGWCELERSLVEVGSPELDEVDCGIAAAVAERIPDGACIRAGIGAIPNQVLASLGGHRDLGIHTELLSAGVLDVVESGVVTGVRKVRCPGRWSRPSRSAPAGCTTSSMATPPSSCSLSTGSTPRVIAHDADVRLDQRHI